MSETQYVIVRETLWKSFCSDLITVLSFVTMIGLGWLLQSSAMQWVGGLLFLISMAARISQEGKRMTADQAIAHIQKTRGAK